MTPRTVAVIPARYASTRFPGKPLAMLRGRPIIEHVYTRVRECSSIHGVLVATDDERILDAVRGFGGEAVMTSSAHRSGSDRLGEVAEGLNADVIVNVQGDEPMIEPRVIDAVLEPMGNRNPPDISTAAVLLSDEEHYLSPDVVKVVVDSNGRALYFSRSPVPYGWSKGGVGLRHLGIYAYRRDSLLRFVSLKQTPLEVSENLEQLRALENGMDIMVVKVDGFSGIGVDTPDDLERAERMMIEREEGTGAPGGVKRGGS